VYGVELQDEADPIFTALEKALHCVEGMASGTFLVDFIPLRESLYISLNPYYTNLI
jgi:hypothetical protein